MTSKELEKYLQTEIDSNIVIREHPKLAGLSNIFWCNEEICPCPTFDVRPEQDSRYTYEFPWGTVAEHNSVAKITELLKDKIAFFRSPEYQELLKDEMSPDARVVFHEATINLKPLDESTSTI